LEIEMPDAARQEFSRLAREAYDMPEGVPLAELLDMLNLRRAARLGPNVPKVGIIVYTAPPAPPPPAPPPTDEEDWFRKVTP
jgi:hypothetical protein